MALEVAWQHVWARWSDDQAHDDLLRLCSELNMLPQLAHRYEEIARHHPDPRRRHEAAAHRSTLAHPRP